MLYDHEKTIARMAPPLAWYCSEEARAAIASDVPATPPQSPSMFRHPLQCFDNFVGCTLADISSPVYGDYQHRLQDAATRLKTAATLVWLRDRPEGQPLAERLASRPPSLRNLRCEPRIGKDGATLSIALLDTRHGRSWSLPLPASRQTQAQAIRTSP